MNQIMYTSNPYIGKVRRLAVNDVVIRGLSYSEAGRKYGVTKSAICKWLKKASTDHREFIHTLPSRPKSHPNQLNSVIIERIISLRKELNRCAPVIHRHMLLEGYPVSLSSVGRVLSRYGLTRKKKQARWGKRIKRPVPDKPGALVQADTMHITRSDYSRFYVYAVLDTFSRLGYAQYQPRMTQLASVDVIQSATNYFGFPFSVVQTDNGPEFKSGFEYNLSHRKIQVRHSRVRRPNDNAHIERFIRTIQDECFKGKYPKESSAQQKLTKYITFYNEKRLHLSLNLETPRQFVSKVLD